MLFCLTAKRLEETPQESSSKFVNTTKICDFFVWLCLWWLSWAACVSLPVSGGSGQSYHQVWDLATLVPPQFTARNQFRPVHGQSRGRPRVNIHTHTQVAQYDKLASVQTCCGIVLLVLCNFPPTTFEKCSGWEQKQLFALLICSRLTQFSINCLQQAEERHQVIYWSIVWEEGEGSNGADYSRPGWTDSTGLNRYNGDYIPYPTLMQIVSECVCDLKTYKWTLSCCIPDFEMGIGDTMTLGKLGTQAERDRRMKKK